MSDTEFAAFVTGGLLGLAGGLSFSLWLLVEYFSLDNPMLSMALFGPVVVLSVFCGFVVPLIVGVVFVEAYRRVA